MTSDPWSEYPYEDEIGGGIPFIAAVRPPTPTNVDLTPDTLLDDTDGNPPHLDTLRIARRAGGVDLGDT